MYPVYIKSASAISPQKTFDGLLNEVLNYSGNRLSCIEPDYKLLLDVKALRRMSRILKMSTVTALDCLKKSSLTLPDAIIVGTAYGCLKDTEGFLAQMIEQNEEMLNPTPFIQSTHNTIAAQIALFLQCQKYNNTFANGGSSFECALQDATMLIAENQAKNILIGGVDEQTDTSHKLLSRFGLYRKGLSSNFDLYDSGRGTIGGEGAAFFILSDKSAPEQLARLEGLSTLYKPENSEKIKTWIQTFLDSNSINASEIDLFILGRNGDKKNDEIFVEVKTLFLTTPTINYKHLSGEYPTSTAFALWQGATILSERKGVKSILIYNHYQNIHHSLILIKAC